MRARLVVSVLGFALAARFSAPAQASSDHVRSPHVEIEAVAVVDTAPRKTVHHNGRKFEEFDVHIQSARAVPDVAGSDPTLVIDKMHRVHVVHDLSCGGAWIAVKPGQHVHLRGEYVHPPHGRNIIHFTHPADASCGRGAMHPDGFLRAVD